jgi:natural product precursor
MKKLSSLNLGKGLKREEMKAIKGGQMRDTYECTCPNGTNPTVPDASFCEAWCE